jgi:YcaO-like protein with predicted kinase domain
MTAADPLASPADAYRIRPPGETVADFGRHAATFGITRLANLTGLDCVGIPVHSAIRPNSRSLSVSQGKGVTHEAARASALMESLEYWHAEHVDLPLRHESYAALVAEGVGVVNAGQLPLRAELDGVDGGSQPTPVRVRFHPARPYLWVRGFDVLNRQSCWVPFETVTINKVALDYANTTFRLGSNGLASGNTMIEAQLHAVCELIERDAVTLWWQSIGSPQDVVRSKISPDSITDPACRELWGRFTAAGLDVTAWDLTSDLGIPTFQCCVVEGSDRVSWRQFGACWGYGTHPVAAIALSRALTEAAQTRVTVIAGSRDDNFRFAYRTHHAQENLGAIRRTFFSGHGLRDFCEIPQLGGKDAESDLAVILSRLRATGVREAIAVDLTKSELGVPVVKMIVPGLEFSSLFIGFSPGSRARAKETAT